MAELIKKLINIQSSLNAPKGQYNSFGKYHYRSCEDIMAALKPLLKQEGVLQYITDDVVMVGDRFYVKATVTLTDGVDSISNSSFAREEETKKGADGSQITGSASSYARKYALNGMYNIDDSKDADTNEHRQQITSAPPQQKPKPKPADILAAFSEAALSKKTPEELKLSFAKAWQMLDGTPEQAKAKDVYDLKKSEIEGATA